MIDRKMLHEIQKDCEELMHRPDADNAIFRLANYVKALAVIIELHFKQANNPDHHTE